MDGQRPTWRPDRSGHPHLLVVGVLLQVKATDPVTQDQLNQLRGDRYVEEISGDVGGIDVWATITWRTADMTGAFTWATNRVLDRIPGRLVRAVLDEVNE